VGGGEEQEQLAEAVTRRTRLFLISLSLAIVAVVAFDVFRPAPFVPVPRANPAPPPSAPEVRRGLNKTPLLYPAEFTSELSESVAASFLTVETRAAGGGEVLRGIAVGEHEVLVAPARLPDSWRVTHRDGHAHEVSRIAADAAHGVALLTVEGAALTPLPIAGAGASLGEPVVAITVGRDVSRPFPTIMDQPLTFARLVGRLATDITPGAIVVSLEGSLLAFVAAGSGGANPLAAPELADIVGSLSRTGVHRHPWTGVHLQTIDAPLRARFPKGALVVVHVDPESGAADVLSSGTVLSSVRGGGRTATVVEQVAQAMDRASSLSFVRLDGESIDVPVLDRQLPPGFASDAAGVNLAGDPLRLEVAPMSAAASRGLRTGDIVRAVDLRPVRSAAQVESVMRGSTDRLLTIQRGAAWRFVVWTARPAERRP
jgi:S1-C subfamily serine protease